MKKKTLLNVFQISWSVYFFNVLEGALCFPTWVCLDANNFCILLHFVTIFHFLDSAVISKRILV